MQTYGGTSLRRARGQADLLVGAALFALTLSVYWRTLAPGVAYLFDDSLEFQLLAWRMAIPHPTGYPLYALLLKLATFVPLGDIAFRANLVSAVSGALAVALTYLAGRELTARFVTGETLPGEVLARVPALVGALLLAFGFTFWSQAVIAEVYAPQALLTALLIWLALRWGLACSPSLLRGQGRVNQRYAAVAANPGGVKSLVLLAFVGGLMLAHHRIGVLTLPAVAVYVLSCQRGFLKQPGTLLKLAVAFVLPLLFYLYLPLRGTVTSSLDGAYQNTVEGFFNWVLGTAYTVFITQNPFNEVRGGDYYLALWTRQFTGAGLLIAAGGLVALFLRAWREWLLVALGLAANLIFALNYRVADVDVFFIPAFVFGALLLTAGLAGLLWVAYYLSRTRWATMASAAGAILTLAIVASLYRGNLERADLSHKTDVAEYGRAILTQPLPENSTVVGILGEMTLLRYFQETAALRPEIETVAADREEDRTRAVEAALARGQTVFLTRPLKGIENEHALSALGPLIEVQTRPNKKDPPTPGVALNADFGDVQLLGYSASVEERNTRLLPMTLYWQPTARISNDRLVSLKLLGDNGQLAGQIDRKPVLEAYPTTAWRTGEFIADYYAVPLFVGARPGEYALQVTLYDPTTGQVYGQAELEKVSVRAQTETVPAELLGVSSIVLDVIGGLELAGYTLDTTDAFAPGAHVPLTLLWRTPQAGTARRAELTLLDPTGKVVTTVTTDLGGQDVAAGQYLRSEETLQLPENLPAGKYQVRLAVRGGGPGSASNGLTLGTVEVAVP